MTELEIHAGEALERTMERYARLRLDPTTVETRRARAAVMEAAWRQRIAAGADGARSATRMPRHAARRWQRVGAGMAAAVIAGLMMGTTAFATSRAGGPLYEARLALEEATLPSDPAARLEAELGLAQGRLAEVVDGVARHDSTATSAALVAYLDSLDDLDGATGPAADRALSAVQSHRAVLLDLIGTVPGAAASGLQEALAHSGAVVTTLAAAGSPGHGSGNASGGGNGNGGGANGGHGTGGVGGNAAGGGGAGAGNGGGGANAGAGNGGANAGGGNGNGGNGNGGANAGGGNSNGGGGGNGNGGAPAGGGGGDRGDGTAGSNGNPASKPSEKPARPSREPKSTAAPRSDHAPAPSAAPPTDGRQEQPPAR